LSGATVLLSLKYRQRTAAPTNKKPRPGWRLTGVVGSKRDGMQTATPWYSSRVPGARHRFAYHQRAQTPRHLLLLRSGTELPRGICLVNACRFFLPGGTSERAPPGRPYSAGTPATARLFVHGRFLAGGSVLRFPYKPWTHCSARCALSRCFSRLANGSEGLRIEVMAECPPKWPKIL
jgi:hypothetical protein